MKKFGRYVTLLVQAYWRRVLLRLSLVKLRKEVVQERQKYPMPFGILVKSLV